MRNQNSLPSVFLDRIKTILPVDFNPSEGFAMPKHKSFRINTLKLSLAEARKALTEQAIPFDVVPWYEPAFTVPVEFARQVLDSALAQEGKIYAQGLESMLPVIALDPKPGEVVLDLCAAPGSKTTQIAAHMQNQGKLIANEHVRDRFYRLRSVVAIMGAEAELKMNDGRKFTGAGNLFDRILVDAPCSSEGRFKTDDPKSTLYWNVRKIHEMAHKQKGLLLSASRLLKPGGELVYSTCTFAPEENEAVVDWLLRKTEGRLSIEEIRMKSIASYPAVTTWNDRNFNAAVAKSLRVLPTEKLEGFFLAKFKLAT